MAKEIERKFLVDLKKVGPLVNGKPIQQGYIPTSGNTVVRVRLKDDKAFLTIKSENIGIVRDEFEYAIPPVDAQEMIGSLCGDCVIHKTRYEIPYDEHIWELDIFHDLNEGLVIAEIELQSEDENFQKPIWVVREVTGDKRLYNSRLVDKPYTQWSDRDKIDLKFIE